MKWLDFNWWKAALATALVIYSAFMFVACGAPKTVSKQTFITDKQNESKWDSLLNVRLMKELEIYRNTHQENAKTTIKEKSYVKDSISSRYDSGGKKIGEDKYHYERHEVSTEEVKSLQDSVAHYKVYFDSTSIYRNRCDSLVMTIDSISKDVEYIEKPLSKMQEVFLRTGQIFYFCLVIVIIYLIYICRRKSS